MPIGGYQQTIATRAVGKSIPKQDKTGYGVITLPHLIKTLRHEQNGCHFVDDIFFTIVWKRLFVFAFEVRRNLFSIGLIDSIVGVGSVSGVVFEQVLSWTNDDTFRKPYASLGLNVLNRLNMKSELVPSVTLLAVRSFLSALGRVVLICVWVMVFVRKCKTNLLFLVVIYWHKEPEHQLPWCTTIRTWKSQDWCVGSVWWRHSMDVYCWPFVRGIHRWIPLTKTSRMTSNVELWFILCCKPVYTVDQTYDVSMIWGATTLMWRHCDDVVYQHRDEYHVCKVAYGIFCMSWGTWLSATESIKCILTGPY